jgi:release factor glutamine methyltransferase
MVEIGTGSGCLSITLARLYPHWQIHACDISSSALRVARNNAYLHRCHYIQFHRGNLFDSHFLEHSSFDLIISNPPYISKEEISHCDQGIFHEPSIALFAHPPLKFYLEIISRAKQGWLNENGYLIFECSPFNIHQIEELFIKNHFEQIEIRFDRNQLPRIISAKKKKKT